MNGYETKKKGEKRDMRERERERFNINMLDVSFTLDHGLDITL